MLQVMLWGFSNCWKSSLVHARVAIGSVAPLEAFLNRLGESAIILTALAGRSAKPLVERAGNNVHYLAHHPYEPYPQWRTIKVYFAADPWQSILALSLGFCTSY